MPSALTVEPIDDRLVSLAVVHSVELARVHHRTVADERELVLVAADHPPDRQVERDCERIVTFVVRRNGHDRAGSVLHQHVVGDEHRQLLAVDRIRHGPPERDACLRLLDVSALLARLAPRPVYVVVDLELVLGSRRQAEHVGVLRRHHEERRAEQRVGTGREHRIVDPQLLAAERHLGALAATDPVPLHRLDVLGPVDPVKVVEQAVRVVGDPEEPLLELPQLDLRATTLAVAVDHLLVGEHRLVDRTPVDRRLLAIGEAPLEQLQEQPLSPAVVGRLMRGDLPRPVDRDPPRAERGLERGDRLVGRPTRVDAGPDRVVLGGQAERVVAHRVQDPLADASVKVRDRVAQRVVLEMADVGLAARVRQHLQHVGLLARVVLAEVIGIVGHLPGALPFPQALPLGLDLLGVIAAI